MEMELDFQHHLEKIREEFCAIWDQFEDKNRDLKEIKARQKKANADFRALKAEMKEVGMLKETRPMSLDVMMTKFIKQKKAEH